jgi:hypothetical protein
MKMKKTILIKTVLLALLFSADALSAALPIGSQNLTFENILTNPGFENGSYGWTASGGAIKAANATAKGFGSFGYDWDSNAAAQTLTSTLVTIPAGLQGRNGVAYCSFKTVSGTATHTFTVDDGTNNLVTPVTIQSGTSSFVKNSTNFIFPSSGSVRIKVTSVAANEPEIYIDSCYMGEANNIGSTSQAQLLGTVKITGCSANWSTNAVAPSDFSPLTGCAYAVTGSAIAPSTNIPAIKFASLAAGNYMLQYEGQATQANGQGAYFNFWDGTNAAPETSFVGNGSGVSTPGLNQSISYSSPQTNVTLSIRAYASSASYAATLAGTTALPGVIKVWYFPSAQSQTINPNVTPASWSGYQNGISGGCSTASATYADPSACTGIALTQITNRNFGSVTSASGSLPGITFNAPKVGNYEICANPGISDSASSNVGARLVDGSGVVINPGTSVIVPNGFSGQPVSYPALCGGYNVTSIGSPITVKVQMGTNSGTAAITQAFGPTGTAAIQWTIKELDAAMPSPVLVGNVTTDSLSAERMVRIKFYGASAGTVCSISTCGVSSSLSGVTVTRSGTGLYSLNFPAGTFTALPACTGMASEQNFNGDVFVQNSTQTLTAYPFQTTRVTNVNFDMSGDIICIGPK